MITFDECGAMLDEIADSMPYELYRDLNFITRFAIITSILQVAMISEFLTEIRLTITLENPGNNQMKF